MVDVDLVEVTGASCGVEFVGRGMWIRVVDEVLV